MEAVGSSGGSRKLWRQQEALEVVEGSEAVSTKLWRWQEALEAIGSSGGGRRLGGSKHEALEVVEGSEAASTELWRRLEGCCGGSRKLWRHQGALEVVARSGGGSEVWRHMLPIAYSSPTRRYLPFTSCPPSTSDSTSCLPSTRDLALAHHLSYACYPAAMAVYGLLPSRLIVLVEEV